MSVWHVVLCIVTIYIDYFFLYCYLRRLQNTVIGITLKLQS